MTLTPFRLAALAAAALSGLASATGTGDNHRQPGPAHRKAAPAQEQSVVSSSTPLAARPVRPTTVKAVRRTIGPRRGDPRVTLNPQPIPPGRSKVKSP